MKKIILSAVVMLVSVMTMGQLMNLPGLDSEYMKSAMQAFEAKDYESAIVYFNQELVVNPKNGYAFLYKAMCSDLDNEVLIDMVKKAIYYIPKEDETMLAFAYDELGNMYMEENMLDKAMACFDKQYKMNKDNYRALSNISTCYYAMEDFVNADKCLDMMLQMDGTDPQILFMKMNVMYNLKEYDEALKLCDLIMGLNSDIKYIHELKAKILESTGNLEGAIDEYMEIFEMDKSNPDALVMVINYLYDEESEDYAFAKLRMYSVLHPNEMMIRFLIGGYYEHKSDYGNALECYKTVLANDRLNMMVMSSIIKCYFYMKEYRNVLGMCDMMNSVNPKSAEAYLWRCKAYYAQGNKDKALECLEKCMECNQEGFDVQSKEYNLNEMMGEPEFRDMIERYRKE